MIVYSGIYRGLPLAAACVIYSVSQSITTWATDDCHLKQIATSQFKTVLFPLRQPLNQLKPEPATSALLQSPTTPLPYAYEIKGSFAPRPRGKRPGVRPVPVTSDAGRSPSEPVRRIDPSRDLLAFTNYTPSSPDVVAWLRSNPIYGRRALNSLQMGRAHGELNGIKFLSPFESSRYAGPNYKLEFHGNYRALMILVSGTWQALVIVHKDEMRHEVQLLTSLD